MSWSPLQSEGNTDLANAVPARSIAEKLATDEKVKLALRLLDIADDPGHPDQKTARRLIRNLGIGTLTAESQGAAEAKVRVLAAAALVKAMEERQREPQETTVVVRIGPDGSQQTIRGGEAALLLAVKTGPAPDIDRLNLDELKALEKIILKTHGELPEQQRPGKLAIVETDFVASEEEDR